MVAGMQWLQQMTFPGGLVLDENSTPRGSAGNNFVYDDAG
jgi:hypothetical protein